MNPANAPSPSRHPPTYTRMRENTATPNHGSRTITIDPAQTEEQQSDDENEEHVGILRLRGDMSVRRPRAIQWDESVIDNEHMNKKKSKICCIYHRPHAVGESSESESSNSSDSSSSSDSDSDGGECSHGHHRRHHRKGKKRNPRQVSPNAYERQPVYKDRPQPPSTSK